MNRFEKSSKSSSKSCKDDDESPLDDKKQSKLTKLLYPEHSNLETAIWTSTWCFGVGYAIYQCYVASQHFMPRLAEYDLDAGSLVDRPRDNTDTEWMVFSKNMKQTIPWLLLHSVGSQYFKKFNKQMLPYYYLLLSSVFLSRLLGLNAFVFLLVQPIAFYLLHFLGSAILIWILAILFLICGNTWPMEELKLTLLSNQSHNDLYIIAVASCWINSRCVSFCLDHAWKDVPNSQSPFSKLIHLLSFCFYLPICIGGPLINYIDFYRGIIAEYSGWTLKRFVESVSLMLRYVFWFLVAEMILHYFYFSALQYNPHILKELDMWTLSGVGYSMGQFFQIKYVVFYGFPRAFVLADDIPAPPHPKCIGRIHLYSDMWRYFDSGLYKFMHRYIYDPLTGIRSHVLVKLFASLICFSFVYIWHGIQEHILIWSALNNLGIIVETSAKLISRTNIYSRFELAYFSPEGSRRLHSFLISPLFLMSILSNFYFFMGTHVGGMFLKKALTSWPIGTPVLLLILTAGAQVSIDVKNWEIRSKLQS